MFSISTHRRFRDQLSAYIDGELRASAAERLETHLAACEGCRLELGQLRATAAALHDLPEVQAPRSFTLSPKATRLGESLSKGKPPEGLSPPKEKPCADLRPPSGGDYLPQLHLVQRPVQVSRRVDQRDVRERLRVVPQELPRLRLHHLRE